MDEADVVEEKKVFSISPKFAEYLEGLVDASDTQEGGGVILYWNDLAVDARYANSNPSLQAVRISFIQLIHTSHLECDNSQLFHVHAMALFSPMFRIRQNLVNVIFVLDLSQIRSLSLLSSLSEHFVARGFPVRWGFVPEGEGDSGFINALCTVQCSRFTRS
jgi:UDP-glucose:glycoprotein glucosyltransferase